MLSGIHIGILVATIPLFTWLWYYLTICYLRLIHLIYQPLHPDLPINASNEDIERYFWLVMYWVMEDSVVVMYLVLDCLVEIFNWIVGLFSPYFGLVLPFVLWVVLKGTVDQCRGSSFPTPTPTS